MEEAYRRERTGHIESNSGAHDEGNAESLILTEFESERMLCT